MFTQAAEEKKININIFPGADLQDEGLFWFKVELIKS